MKNFVNYFYNLYPEVIHKKKNYFYFYYDGEKYYIIKNYIDYKELK